MEPKQRLIELIADYTDSVTARELHSAEFDEYFADHLLANGVTIRERGEWKINSDGYYPYCPRCMEEPEGGKMTDFCPHCGADMRGGKDE